MLILIILVTLAATVYCFSIYQEELIGFLSVTFIIELVICGLLGWSIVDGRVIDEKISMYAEENTVIEAQIQTVIKEYMNHEKETFKDCSAESMITLVDLYPELKSDTLVSKQIDVYLNNNNEIKNLKREKINISSYKWFVYFGK